jgi:long-chain acyl-CoA synthetase
MTAKVITPRQSHTSEQFERDLLGFAQYLRQKGVKKGDRVLLKGKNSYSFAVVFFSLIHLDTSIILVDHQQSRKKTERVLERTNFRWCLLDKVDRDEWLDERIIGYPEKVAEIESHRLELTESFSMSAWRERRDAAILWSSGSTGEPKGIVKSGQSILDNIEQTRIAMAYRDDDVLMPLLPFSHYYGLSILLIWWQQQCSLIIPQYQILNQVVNLIAREGVTVIDAAPSTYYSLLDLAAKKPAVIEHMHRVRMWCVGGAPLSKQLANRFRQTFHMPLLDGYGLTEVGNVAVSNPTFPHACGLPLKGVDVRILDENGNDVPVGTIGGIKVSSCGLMAGYLTENGEIASPTSPWYDTGDLGMFDADGNLHVIGRKHAVHRMGYTLYPASLEKKAEACGYPIKVIALDEERKGCRLHFFIADPEGRSPQFWKKQIYPLLAPYETPDEIWVMQQFPLNHNGKVDLFQLRRIAVRQMTAKLVDGRDESYVLPGSTLDGP